ncbi:MAG: hypothetical protein AABW52_04700 [Nanoarchaeota archaeon]
MKLKKWCSKAEELRSEIADEYFNMQVGLEYSKEKINKLEKTNSELAKTFLKNYTEPKDLYYDSISSQLSEKLSKLMIKFNEERKKKISTKINGKEINWTSWRQYVVNAKDQERKNVFDTFIEKTKHITPIIEETFETYRKVYKSHDVDLLEPYFYQHKTTYNKLKNTVDELGSSLKKTFQKQFNHYSNELNNRNAEYHDDFYYMRNAVFSKIKTTNKFNSLESIKNRMKILGFNIDKIYVDDKDRKDKYSSPFCESVKIPTDVRVSYKDEDFLNTLGSIYHEFGHAVHFTSIDKNLEYWKKYYCSEALCETFSTFFEELVSNKDYLTKELKFKEQEGENIVKRSKFNELYAMTFYSANSIFKMEYWKQNMTMEEANEYYNKMIKKYMGMEVDGRYWQLHHILPESVLYVPSYLLARIRASELKKKLEQMHGNEWYNNKESGEWLRELMKPGTESRIASFDNINPEVLIKELK